MSLVGRIKASSGPGVGPNPFNSFNRYPFWWARSEAGKTVTVDKAMRFDAVWACIRLRANSTSQLPLKVFERVGDDDYQPAKNQPVMKLLRKPNPEMVRANLWSLVSTHLNTHGNAYLGKVFTRQVDLRSSTGYRDVVTELWPIPPDCVRVARENGQKRFYVRQADGGAENPTPFTSGEIIHVMGFSLDGLVGLSPISYARETVGAGLAMDHFVNVFWKNSGIAPLVLTTDNEVTDEGRKRIRRDWDRISRGYRNAWRTAILEQGVKPVPLSLSAPDANFVAAGDHTIQKICRWFGLWPSMIGASSGDAMTYKNLEGEALRFLMFSMNPEWSLIEQTLEGDADLFPMRPGDVETRFFPEFVRSKFLQTDPLTEAQVFTAASGRRAWMLPSEIRKVKNLPPDKSIDDPVANPFGSSPAAPAGHTGAGG